MICDWPAATIAVARKLTDLYIVFAAYSAIHTVVQISARSYSPWRRATSSHLDVPADTFWAGNTVSGQEHASAQQGVALPAQQPPDTYTEAHPSSG
ncbi:hypothetical protein M404DRAFT_32738 [Pisolithus tinctorius Marx 270]|uniref:Uncharacterized protein n=1 Tax=Pisolithus tinctorius Marx 270 TaxID=870435 RepID=A0A0C3N7H6_PISTI|nr:hypothetical protein M404DRAFT_32738 [Pisolithus tinctorius Marx 270]